MTDTTQRIRNRGHVRASDGNWVRASVAPPIRWIAQAVRLVRGDA